MTFRDKFFERLTAHLTTVDSGRWWNERGECLMSGTDTLDSNDGVMILGLNPGGGRDGSELPPLKDQVEAFRRRREGPFSTYLDECWHYTRQTDGFVGWPHRTCDACAGASTPASTNEPTIKQEKHQKAVSSIAKDLRFDLRRAVALNAFWVQTTDAVALAGQARASTHGSGAGAHAKATVSSLFSRVYLPIIRDLIAGAKISRIICLGNGRYLSPFRLLADAYGVSDVSWKSEYREGRSFERDGLRVFGIPHPSMHTLSVTGRDNIRQWYQGG